MTTENLPEEVVAAIEAEALSIVPKNPKDYADVAEFYDGIRQKEVESLKEGALIYHKVAGSSSLQAEVEKLRAQLEYIKTHPVGFNPSLEKQSANLKSAAHAAWIGAGGSEQDFKVWHKRRCKLNLNSVLTP